MIDGMSPEPQHARADAKGWTFWQGAFAAILSLATLGTAGPAGYSVYRTSYNFAYPMLGREAWILPVALEAVFAVLFGWGIILAWRKVADVPVRVIGSAAIATLSFAVQIDAGHGSFSAILVRVAIVASFFVAGFTMKAAFMRLRGGKVKGDRISLGEWLASPARATGLWRWKNAWGEPSTSAARQRYMVLLYVIALAQSDPRVGKRPLRWRRGLPVTLRYELSTGLLPEAFAAGEGEWRDAAWAHVSAQLSLLPPVQSGSTDERTSGDSDERAGRDTDERSSGDTDERKTGDTDRSTWPEPKDIDPQVLARMVRTAIGRWERTHDDGKPLPALQLERHIKVRMSRKTAADLLATGYAAVGQRKSGAQ